MVALRTLLFIITFSFYFCGIAYAANCASSPLPDAPVYPSSTLSASLTPSPSLLNPLTKGHWSEKAKLSDYRPPAATIVAKPAQTNCPHTQSGLKNWHDPSTWPSNTVPQNGSDVSLPLSTSILISSCSFDPSFVFGLITIPVSSSLVFDDAVISVGATGFNVMGSLQIGSETCRLRNKVTITLHGKRGEKDATITWVKGIAVSGKIDVHGVQYFPTWTRLAMTAKINDTIIFVQDVVNWQAGQRIVITTTELKDARDWHRNEEKIIKSVKKTTLDPSVSAIELETPLSYYHFGGKEYQAEVSLLSRNIVIQGALDSLPTDTANSTCKDTTASTYPCENSWLTGFGGHVIVYGNSSEGRFSGVEYFRMGQTNVLGRYSLHFHLMGNITQSNYKRAYAQDCAVHDSYFRCFAIHGTSGAKLTQNTAYNVIGHCYFLEDGVEEENIISYNSAALIHPLGPIINPSTNQNGDGWGGQYLNLYNEGPKLLLPSDMSAGCFYITNTYNDFYGNAASGGWAGFAIPSLPLPVKLFRNTTGLSPANRPFRSPFAGNSAHSSGYWWNSAGSIYVGGTLSHAPNGTLQYTAGRSSTRNTCAAKTSGGCGAADLRWLRFEDNKVFLSNRGMQHWGTRSEIIRLELHDVSLAMNVFGKVWISEMLMECRTMTNRVTFFNGCSGAPVEGSNGWGNCNVRDYTYFRTFGGFQWYDVGQQHILTDSTFRNCRSDWYRCSSGSSKLCSSVAVFSSLTHSDQFVPELMQVTSGIVYENVTDLWRYSTSASSAVSVSGRLQNWYDPDGSASQMNVRTMIGSSRANNWWRYNDKCVLYKEAFKCPLSPGDSSVSAVMKLYNEAETEIGETNCMNGGGKYPCPVIAQISHFGSKNESDGLSVGVNAKITGPIIASSGGWFIRYNNGTPKKLTFVSLQVKMEDNFLIALPYPAGTTFSLYHKAASWCGSSNICRKNITSVNSVAAVRSAFGDAYYWNSGAKTLYLRLVQANNTFGSSRTGNASLPWRPSPPEDLFSRGGQTLFSATSSSIVIESSCATDPCAPQNDVKVPAAMFIPTSSPSITTSSPSVSAGGGGGGAAGGAGAGAGAGNGGSSDESLPSASPSPSLSGDNIKENSGIYLVPSIFVLVISFALFFL